MIEHPTWRSLIYRLAEEYPDCLMLNFTIKLISDAGFQSEITSISTAAQQIEVFSRVLKTAITKFLTNPDDVQNSILECAVSGTSRKFLKSVHSHFVFSFRRKWSVMDNIRTSTAKFSYRFSPKRSKGVST